jgi:Mrp family chromosome partitioning ATPase
MLTAGTIVTGELLRMTAPRAVAAIAAAPAAIRAKAATVRAAAEPEFELEPETEPDAAPVLRNSPDIESPGIAPELSDMERLADDLRGAGDAARKVTVLGTASNESITLTALTLARLIARQARVVVVDLQASSPTFQAVSVDPAAPGLVELMLGEASFSQIITKDKLSRAHLVTSGRPGTDRSLLQSPRLSLAIDALLRVYDHVVLDAGTASDLPAELLTAQARAVVVPDASMASDARTLMCDQLRAVGFSDVTMLSRPVQSSSDTVQPGPRVVAA